MATIRRARLDDATAVAALTVELGYDSAPDEIRKRLELLLEAPGSAVFVAENAERAIVGWILCDLVASLETEMFAEIRGLIVTSGSRSAGIGSQLVRTAEEWAGRAGVKRMRVRSNITRQRARDFYERLGYRLQKTQNAFDRNL